MADDIKLTLIKANPEMRQAIKGMLILGLAFCLHFTAYNGLGNLQSSLHRQAGMGVITQALLYAFVMISNFFMPSFTISYIGHRKTIVICFVGYMAWMAANGYAVWGTMIPTSIIVGLCAGPLWVAQLSYVRDMAKRYAVASKQTADLNNITIRFFSTWSFCYGIYNIFYSMINYFVLRKQSANNNTLVNINDLGQCGANDCPWNNKNNTNLEEQPKTVVWTLVGIYMGLSLLAVLLVFFFLEDFKTTTMTNGESKQISPCVLLRKSVKQLVRLYQLLMLPDKLFAGLRMSLVFADWNKSFVSCTMGIAMIGLLDVPMSIARPFFALFPGLAVKFTGRLSLILSGYLLSISLMVFLLLWRPHPDHAWLFYVVSLLTQLSTCLVEVSWKGVIVDCFPEDADICFATRYMVGTFGACVGFLLSGILCTRIKLYMGLVTVIMSILSYITIEKLLRVGWAAKIPTAEAESLDGEQTSPYIQNKEA